VAALAGIPREVTTEARRYLRELERERDALRSRSSVQAELPLFPAPPASAAPSASPPPAAPSAALAALRAVDPNALSPRAALDLVYRLLALDASDS
jgi:DNA mismatch repair protein MutS